MKYTQFCYVCKNHIEVEADNKKDAIQKFLSLGHDDTKVRELKRNIQVSHWLSG